MNPWLFFGVIALLLVNAFFVGAEFAIISARRSSIEPRALAGSRAAKTVLWAMEHVSLMLACAQLGITVASISLGVVAEPAIAHALEPIMLSLGLPESAAHIVALIIALTIIVSLHVIIGEMVPKNAAVANPDRAAMMLAPPLVAIARVLKPIIAALNWIANCIVRLLGVEPRDEVTSAFTADEVQSIVDRSSAEGTLDDASGLLKGAIEFSDHAAQDVMVPLAGVVSARAGITVEGLEALAVRTGFSRFPVVNGDAFVGYLHIKDTLFARPTEREEAIHSWRVRDLPVVGASDEVEDVLALMRRSGAHIALVVGTDGPVGLAFLEDIIEELVGEVSGSL